MSRNMTKPAVPVEVITVTVQRSVHYIETDDINLALASVRHHVATNPECYDDIDDVIAYSHTVRLPEGAPNITEVEEDIELDTPADLTYPIDPREVMARQNRSL